MIVRFVVLSKPTPKGGLNARYFPKTGKVGLFYPTAVKRAQATFKAVAADEMRRSSYPLIGARCTVHLHFYVTPCKNGKLIGDIDKLCRLALDAMTGTVFEDDNLVVGLTSLKKPVGKGEVPRTEVSVSIAA